jgi:glycosyltransferase involved in cell wall biosynthesis
MRLILDLQACQAASMHRGIGRYSIALALAIARNSAGHDLRIVLNNAFPEGAAAVRKAFDGLVPASSMVSFTTTIPAASLDPANGWRVQAAERIREHYLASLRPDVVHMASLFEGLSDDCVTSLLHGEGRFDTAITLYDLIPLLRKERYLADPNMAAWYYRKLQSLKNAELLLAISGHAREEAIGALQLAPDSVVNISSAVDTIFQPRPLAPDARSALLARHGLRRPFIMYTGGIDYRKNIEGLIEAYAALPGDMRRQYQLAVVCSVNEADRVRLQRRAAALRLAADDLVLTGFVSDDDLVSLYNCTALFVFPSLHEGFGLPALEAMACGAPVIGSDASSIPEVIGRADALFDPTSVPDIAAAMARVLGNPDHAQALRAHGLVQARLFSWDASAKCAIDAFEETHRRNTAARTVAVAAAVALPRPRPRLAFVSPLPPARSGIADYSGDLLPELARYYDIDLVLAQQTMDHPWAVHNFPQRSVEWFDANAHAFDRIVYQFGNSAFHSHMFGLLERHPGVVVLHDFFLSGVLHHTEGESQLPNQYCRALYFSHGYRALAEEWTTGRIASTRAYPCNRAVLDRATGVIVHSMHAVALARHWYGSEVTRDWQVVPLLRKLPDGIDRTGARRSLGIGADDFLLCSFGMLEPTKCNDAIVEAWIDSDAGRDPRCHLVFVGAVGMNDFGNALRARIADHPRIRITGYASEVMYREYLAAADVAIQLRAGSRGETSAAVLDCLAYGLPTIVNAHGSAAEIPAATCLQLHDAFTLMDVRQAIDTLRADAGLRLRLTNAARAHMQAHSPARAGALVRDAVESFSRDAQGEAEQRLIRSIATIPGDTSDSDQLQTAAAIAGNRPAIGPRQLLIDVTHLAQRAADDAAAQSQRALIVDMLAATSDGWRIEPIRHDGTNFRYARRFTLDLIDRTDVLIEDAVVDPRAGDILLVIDPDIPAALTPAWQRCGVRLYTADTVGALPLTGTALVKLPVAGLPPA